MNEAEIKDTLLTAQSTLGSRSKFSQFCMDLSTRRYGVIGLAPPYDVEDETVLIERPDEVQEEYDLFWKVATIIRATWS